MRRLPPGGFLWLLVHEVRLAHPRRRRSAAAAGLIVGLILLAGFTAAGIVAGRALRRRADRAGRRRC